MISSRRVFLCDVATIGASVLGGNAAIAQSQASSLVVETDANSLALGYRANASTVDTSKFEHYIKGSSCSGCTLFGGKPSDASAPCPIFAGKHVSGKGWCSAWAKRPS